MGGFLDKPITRKDVSMKKGNKMTACAVAMQGWRTGMEMEVKQIESTFQTLYLDLDEQLKNQEEIKKGDRSGCTAVSIFMTDKYISCANAGDSRSVMYCKNKVVPLSFDHKPSNEIEKKRIIEAGGCVVMNRVNGDLAVSRAFGDFGLKNNTSLKAEEQQVIALPDIVTYPKTGDEQFIVIACDGIWDVIDNDTICQRISEELECEPNIEDIGSNMLDYCLNQGSRDNITVEEKVKRRQEEKAIRKKELERQKLEEESKKDIDDDGIIRGIPGSGFK